MYSLYLTPSLLGATLASLVAVAQTDATAIIKKGEKTLRGRSTQAVMHMKITRPTFTRKLTLRSWTLGNRRTLVEILDPPKEEGVSSLRVKANMWNYLPKVDRVMRIPTSMMLQSWMGSDFTNDDLMKSSSLVRDYRHRRLRNTRLGRKRAVLIECIPKPNAPVVWGKVLYWARPKDSLPLKQKFFDENGKWIRTISFSAFKKMDDRVIPTRVVVTTNQGKSHRTEIRYLRVLYDRQLSPRLFSREKLRRVSQRGMVLSEGWITRKMAKR